MATYTSNTGLNSAVGGLIGGGGATGGTGTAASVTVTQAALYTGAAPNGPGTTGASNEVGTGGNPSYARQNVSWGAPSAGVSANTNQQQWTLASAVITTFGLFATSTYVTAAGVLNASQTFSSSGTYTVPIGSLTLNMGG